MSEPVDRLTAALEGRYRIERELGAGGMATVYLATDLKHGRQVAIKVLRAELSAVVGAERFLAEIRTTANLQHPNILPLFDSGEADGLLFYVMPYVAGGSLREKLDRERQLAVSDALAIARKVGDALDYAHGEGVVHRDIKPANVMLSERGEPLVADFGIALAVSAAGGGRITETGLSLGTPYYMSPEQATGERDVDPRSDQYALGCVLYELLAGEPPFAAPTAQAVLARILTETPRRLTELRRTVPEHVAAVVARALEKLPADRFPDLRAMLDALDQEAFRYAAEGAPGSTAARAAPRGVGAPASPRSLAAAGGLVAAGAVAATAALVALGWVGGRSQPGPGDGGTPLMRAAATLPQDFEWSVGGRLQVSPPGSHLAIRGAAGDDAGIWIRAVSDTGFALIQGTDSADVFTFSPDGRQLAAALLGEGLVTMDLTGGNRRQLVGGSIAATAWGDDGWLYYVQAPDATLASELWRVPEDGSAPPEGLGTVASVPTYSVFVDVLPGGVGVLVGQLDLDGRELKTDLWRSATGEIEPLLNDARAARYVPTGHIVFTDRRGDLRAVRFDLEELRVEGSSVQLESRVSSPNAAIARYDIADNGTLVHSSGRVADFERFFGEGSLVELTLDGRTTDWTSGSTFSPRWSPDGEGVLHAAGRSVSSLTLRVYEPELAIRPRALAADVATTPGGVWSPDGRSVVFSGGDGLTNLQPRVALVSGTGSRPIPGLVVPDGSSLSIPFALDWSNAGIVWVVAVDNTGPRGLYLQPDTSEPGALWLEGRITNARVSPNGDHIAYTEETQGVPEIWARRFPEIGPPIRISEAAGGEPVWAPAGDALYFTRTMDGVRQLRRVRLSLDPVLAPIDETTVIDSLDTNLFGFDMHPDGTRFVAARQGATGGDASPDEPDAQITPDRTWIVVNWFERIRAAFADEG